MLIDFVKIIKFRFYYLKFIVIFVRLSNFDFVTKNLKQMQITITNDDLSATIDSKGAELISLIKKKSAENYIWEGSVAFWAKHSPVLFPIVGTLKDNFYLYDNNKYILSRHGFARDCNFEIVNKSYNEVVFSLSSNEKTKKQFPFEFELQIKYLLTNFELKISYLVINKDTISIPFSLGAHPAFSLKSKIENYSLQFENQESLSCFILENGLISDTNYTIELIEKKMPLTYSLFEKDALIFKKIQSKKITLFENEIPKLNILFNDFKNLGLWTVQNARFICIEPWLGYSDTINHNNQLIEKEGIEFVQENCIFNCKLSIEIL